MLSRMVLAPLPRPSCSLGKAWESAAAVPPCSDLRVQAVSPRTGLAASHAVSWEQLQGERGRGEGGAQFSQHP